MKSFWNGLRKPFFAMAPMADVTDAAFRALVAKRGKPDIFWTEFVSADGLYHTREIGKIPDAENPLMRDFQKGAEERPIVAQIFSSKPEMIAYATKLIASLGFDGVDINMGCPDKSIEKQGCGAAMIKNPKLAQEIIRAAQAAASSYAETLIHTTVGNKVMPIPVSVKTRVGYSKESLEEWLTALLQMNPAAITLHLRTRKEMSLVPAQWELMQKAVEIRNRVNPSVLLIGNGDVQDLADAKIKIAESGCDGAMIGRGMFGNPWVFNPNHHFLNAKDLRLGKMEALVELAYGFEKLTPPKHFAILKKHIKAFVTGFDGAADLRAQLMQAESAAELQAILDNR